MPTSDEIRERFRKRLGDERYRDFVYRVPKYADGSRLLFWQEREWDRFIEDNPDCGLNFAGIIDVFSACPEFGAIVRHEAYCDLLFSWLQGDPMSVKDVERKYGTNRIENRQQLESFGIGSKQWQDLKSQIEPGDELYRFRSPPKTWANMAWRAGIALVRNGKVVASLITALN